MKADGAPDVDVTKAVAELKARKKILEAKVRVVIPWRASHRRWVKCHLSYSFTPVCHVGLKETSLIKFPLTDL